MSGAHRILLGVSGSIAAYKAAELVSELRKQEADVRAVMTKGASHFVSPLTFEALTGHPVAIDVWDESPGSTRMGHLDLARWCDALVVAPASASALARLALGLADDLLAAVALASAAPLFLAPAMESTMFEHPATQTNLKTLQERGATIIGPHSGRLASGAIGMGRMAEPGEILETVLRALSGPNDMRGLKVVVTAGPTFEAIDPVRYLGNRSSGKMGYALATDAASRGAHVTLVTGPTALPAPAGVQLSRVETASEMMSETLAALPGADAVIMAAAVADFRPVGQSAEKLKRSGDLSLRFEPTEDIAAAAARAAPDAVHVGFAVESDKLVARAQEKLRRKGQRLVVANAISADFSPFGSDDNRVVLVTDERAETLPAMSKSALACRIWDEVLKLLDRR